MPADIRIRPPGRSKSTNRSAQEDITLEGRHIEITGTYRVMTDEEASQIRQEVTEEWVEIDDLDDAESPTQDDGIEVIEEAADGEDRRGC